MRIPLPTYLLLYDESSKSNMKCAFNKEKRRGLDQFDLSYYRVINVTDRKKTDFESIYIVSNSKHHL